MKRIVALAGLLLLSASLLPLSVPHALAGPQQEKMKSCNAEAGKKDLKGEDRKKFMSECLSARSPEPEKKLTPQQEKMKACNKEAEGKKGDERKKFMSDCLKG